MGYLLGKMVREQDALIDDVPSLKKLVSSKREYIELKWNDSSNQIWFKLGKDVLMRVNKPNTLMILRFHEMDHVEGGGIFTCPKRLKEIHDEIVYENKAYVEGSEEFYFVSLCQYLFDLSPSTIERLGKNGQYIKFKRRSTVKRGRKVGKDYSYAGEDQNEPKEAILERAKWNMKVGRKKRFYPAFEDGYREKCRALNIRFDKKACLDLWTEMDRKERENW